jgi:bifunctional non-homologous end joining protein LigD
MRGVTITHPEKVLFPADGITKGELAEYYDAVADVMLPHIAKRPVTLERYNAGINGPKVFQKNVEKGFPDWLERVQVGKKDGVVNHVIVTEPRGILWLANQNSITPHVWVSRAPRIMYPDILVIDLDPSDDDEKRLRKATLLTRDCLEELGLESWVKTSGSKGFHIVVPLDAKADFGKVARFGHAIGEMLVQLDPKNFTREFYKKDRDGKIMVDTGRNEYSATFAAAYAVRPKKGAPVSAPCTWSEVEKGKVGPMTFTMQNVPKRVKKLGDVWSDLLTTKQALPKL